jgi:MFS-type transporter involved in bile tolerance (Atg22 family)
MIPGEKQPSPPPGSPSALNLTLASVASLGGCLVVIVVLGALSGGLWLDNLLKTKPLFTLALVIGSVPVGIFLMYRVAISVISKSVTKPKMDTSTQGEQQP